MKRTCRLLFFSFTLFCANARSHEGHQSKENPPTPLLTESIYNLSSKWKTQDNKEISLSELRGHPAFLAMVYSNCEHACPVIVEDMKRIENALPAKIKSNFSFYLFSFDSVRDIPAQLKKFSQSKKLDSHQWTLFHGSERAVRELAAVLAIHFKKDSKGDFDHSNLISLIDAEGLIRHQQLGLNQNPEEILQKVNELKP